MTSEIMADTLETESRIEIIGHDNIIGTNITRTTVIVYQGDRPVSVADVLSACKAQVKLAVQQEKVGQKYIPALYVHRAIEQELRAFFTTPWEEAAPNCYVIVAPAGSGKTNLLCHLAEEYAQTQPVVLLMGRRVSLSPTSGLLLGSLQSELQAASRRVNFRSPEDCLHTLHRAAEEIGSDALVILDAINEHDKPLKMRKALEDLLHKTRGKRIKLLITCRDYYWGVFKGSFREGTAINPLPAEIVEDEVDGSDKDDFSRFTADEQETALDLYLQHFGISGRPTGDAAKQCRHPLLLRFFCEAFRDQNVSGIKDIRLKELFDLYWDQKLAFVADRMIKHGPERIPEALQEELGDYLLSIASHMLRNNVRAVPEAEMPKATGLSERRGDPTSVYGRIRDEYIILEKREQGQGRRKTVQVAFVFDAFMEYAMALSLLRDWEAANLDEPAILAAIDALAAQYTSFAQVLGVMVYVGLMLREEREITLWSALMKRGGLWREVVLEAIRKLPDGQIDANVYLVLEEVLSLQDVELTTRVLDILKSGRFGREAPRTLMQKACNLVDHSEESVRRRVMLVAVYAPDDLRLPVVEHGLRDSLRGVRENALTATLALSAESALRLLLRALNDPEARIRAYAVKGLARVGAPSIEPLVAVLGDNDSGVRRQAAEALGRIGDARAVEPLVTTLRDNDSRVRRQAAEALHCLGWVPPSDVDRSWQTMAFQDWASCVRYGASSVEPLVAALRDDDSVVRWQAAEALVVIGAPSVEPLVAALGDNDSGVRRQVAEALGRIGDACAVEPLVAVLSDDDLGVRWQAAEALGRLGDARAVDPLVAVLRDDDIWVRRQAGEALVEIGAPSVDPLVAALRYNDIWARWQAAEALGRIGDACAVEPLVAVLRDNNSGVRRQAAEALNCLGWVPPSDVERSWQIMAIIDHLAAALKDRDVTVRRRAAEALGQIDDPRAAEILTESLKDGDHEDRRFVARILDGNQWQPLNDEQWAWYLVAVEDWNACLKLHEVAIEPLLSLLDDKSVAIRQNAVEALGRLRHQDTVGPLTKVLGLDENPLVRACAAEALGHVGSPSAIEALKSALRDPVQDVRFAAGAALAQYDQTPEIAPLVSFLRDPACSVRERAATALQSFGWEPPDDEHWGWFLMASKDWEECAYIGPCAREPLIFALQDTDIQVRRGAATALIRLKDPKTEKALVRALRDEDEIVRSSAAQALYAISTPTALSAISQHNLGFVVEG